MKSTPYRFVIPVERFHDHDESRLIFLDNAKWKAIHLVTSPHAIKPELIDRDYGLVRDSVDPLKEKYTDKLTRLRRHFEWLAVNQCLDEEVASETFELIDNGIRDYRNYVKNIVSINNLLKKQTKRQMARVLTCIDALRRQSMRKHKAIPVASKDLIETALNMTSFRARVFLPEAVVNRAINKMIHLVDKHILAEMEHRATSKKHNKKDERTPSTTSLPFP